MNSMNEANARVAEKDYQSVWDACLAFIKDNLPGRENEKVFDTWFKPIVPVKLDGGTLIIQVPSPFFYEWLEHNYADLLKQAIQLTLGPQGCLQYSIVMDTSIAEQPITTRIPAVGGQSTMNVPRDAPMDIGQGGRVLPNPFVIPGIQKVRINSQLSGSYTLHNFVEGECNQLARAAGYAVAEKPGKTAFNPLMLHGGVGLGKTHLANAIGLKVKELKPSTRVLYVSAHLFKVQYTDSVRNNTLNDFINFYQTIDVLIIDDIQEFAGSTKTQNTFFYIFNQLHQNGKQLVMTADRAPMLLQGLEDRLVTRFKWGMVAELGKPSLELRKDILRSKVQRDGWEFPEDVIDFVAEHVKDSVRDLEGIAISMMAQATIFNKDIDLELARQTVMKLSYMEEKEITIDDIVETVCKHYGLDTASIQTKSRKHEVVQARQIAMFLAKDNTDFSTARIGKLIGNRDHATVLHAFKTIKELEEVDKNFHEELEEIRIALKNK